jgi:hypothetical protein
MKKLRVKDEADFRGGYLYWRIQDAIKALSSLEGISLEQWESKDFDKEDVTKAAKAVQTEIDAFLSGLRGRYK